MDKKKIYNLLSSSWKKKKTFTLFKLLPVSCRVLMPDEPREHKEHDLLKVCSWEKTHRNVITRANDKGDLVRGRKEGCGHHTGKITHAVHVVLLA